MKKIFTRNNAPYIVLVVLLTIGILFCSIFALLVKIRFGKSSATVSLINKHLALLTPTPFSTTTTPQTPTTVATLSPTTKPSLTATKPITPTLVNNSNCNGVKNDYTNAAKIDQNFDLIRDTLSICISFLTLPEVSFNSHVRDPLTPVDFVKLETLSKYFREEYSKLNKAFIKNIQLKQVVFMKNNVIEGQIRAAVPDFTKDIVYYDISLADNESYARLILHHELYHNIEEARFGSAFYFDKNWNKFNVRDFAYGEGGASCQTTIPPKRIGFVSGYSTCGLEEDKAEIYSYIMTDSYKITLKDDIANGDTILANKTKYMVDFLKQLGLIVTL